MRTTLPVESLSSRVTRRGSVGIPVLIVVATLVWAVLASSRLAIAQAGRELPDDQREQAFVEALRREDPADSERYVKLRDARGHAQRELQRVEAQYRAAGVELRPVFLGQLTQAQRTYAASSLALLDFLDDRDRRAIVKYREEIDRIDAVLEQHRNVRAELEKLLRE